MIHSGLDSALVIGGAGFLGRHLSRALAEQGIPVVVVDDLSCSNSSFDCTELDHPRIATRTGSALDRRLMEVLVDQHPLVCHLASVVGVEETISRPFDTMQNLNGTMNVTRALSPEHVALFTSSADVYGLHSRLYDRPMREDDMLLLEDASVNRWVYAHVKALEENLFVTSPARTAVIRVFNSYGVGMDFPDPKRVVPHFIEAIRQRQPLKLSGDGSQKRSFCHVADTTWGMVEALRHAATIEAGASETFNIGTDRPISIAVLAEAVIAASVEAGLAEYRPTIEPDAFTYSQGFDDTWNRCPDIGKARRLLGFEPRIGLAEGLRQVLPWYANLNQPVLRHA